jgi:hypothetical protein
MPMEFTPLDRDGIAARCARDIPEGWLVNLASASRRWWRTACRKTAR